MKTFKKIILDDLKSRSPQTAALVKKITSIKYSCYSGGDSVNVTAINLFKPERESLESILNEYQDGHFDGMTDMYTYGDKPQKERMAKYVFLKNEFTLDIKDHIKSVLEKDYGVTDDETAKKKMNIWYDQAQWSMIQDLEAAP